MDAKVCTQHKEGRGVVHRNFPGVAMRTTTTTVVVPERDPWVPAKKRTMKRIIHRSHFRWTKPVADCFPEVA